ncbi:MAG: OsmC family protein [Mariniblastus sp.]|nr:OsmC family protein [Mariniblastus sp.]
MHPASGGDGSFRCPVEIMLAGWIGCFGVTLAAVASSMRLKVESCRLKATGLLDFKGTLAVDRDSPVGLLDLKLKVQIVSQEPAESLEKLIELAERYCVVHQTLASPPSLEIKRC